MMEVSLALILAAPATLLAAALVLVIVYRVHFARFRRRSILSLFATGDGDAAPTSKRDTVIAFYHPRCSSGGGGERVLWKMVQCLGQIRESGLQLAVVVYTADPDVTLKEAGGGCDATGEPAGGSETPADGADCDDEKVDTRGENEGQCDSYTERVMRHVRERFGIEVSQKLPVKFVHMDEEWRRLAPKGRVSMVAESAATVRLAWAALNKLTPDVYIDTTGAAFTFLVAKILAGCRVGAYVHYPTISTDMLNMVWERRPSYNNDSGISQSTAKTVVKLVYYSLFAVAYGVVGSLADLVMVNSTWTCNHIKSLWRLAAWRGRIHVVYPPCDTRSLEGLSLEDRENVVLSIGQFRPEKDHTLQLRSFARMLSTHPELKDGGAQLVLVGSCRDGEDEGRVVRLRDLAKMLGIRKHTVFVLDEPYPVLKSWLGKASVGLHTMWNEHFGIGVVEMMAAGLVTVAHNSGGPKADIIVSLKEGEGHGSLSKRTGYLASSAEEYADAMYEALKGGSSRERDEITSIRQCGREQAKKFSDEVFVESFKGVVVNSDILR